MQVLPTDQNISILSGVLFFCGKWCQPCKIVERQLQKYVDVEMWKIDIEEHSNLVSKLNISTVPTLVFIKDGEVAESIIGSVSETRLLGAIKNIA